MQKRTKLTLLLLVFLVVGAYYLYPYLLYQVMQWQKTFNIELSNSLHQLNLQHQKAGFTLILISFFYGIFHAVGPGHGKFILTSYLALEQSKLKQAVKISLASSLIQGIVAILLVSVIVVIFTLSRQYFNVTLQWVERLSFLLMILLGIFWSYQGWKMFRAKPKLQIKKVAILQIPQEKSPLVKPHIHNENCSCRHQHLPSSEQMSQSNSWKSQLLLILSIGSRPCSGAILVLFLSYTLNIYIWGVLATLMMAIGTGITLTLFAIIVVFAREKAVKLHFWYQPKGMNFPLASGVKLLIGIVLVGMGFLLLQSSFIDVSPNNIFKR